MNDIGGHTTLGGADRPFDGILYEVDFSVTDSERFEKWCPDAILEWATLPGVVRFRVFTGVDSERERVRLAFGFAGYDEWRSFIERKTHRECMAMLDNVATDVRTCLWSPAAVTLAAPDDRPAVVDLNADFAVGGDGLEGSDAIAVGSHSGTHLAPSGEQR